MWSPTHVQVAVQRAKDLISKGKSGTNDVYVMIQLKKEKYQTSLKEKSVDPEWYEECDLLINDNHSQDGEVELTVVHRNGLSIDEFLGRVSLPLKDFQIYDPPKSRWYSLESKVGHKPKPRGELEVRICYVVNKVKDPDSVSTASSASRKIKKIKGMANSFGKKITGKGSKQSEMTSDFIPDLTGLDKGVLDMGDIAENYAKPPSGSPAPPPPSKKKDKAPKRPTSSSGIADSISLPGETAGTKASKQSPLFRKLSPMFGRKKAPAPAPPTGSGLAIDTPSSSNASVEDLPSRTSSILESDHAAPAIQGHRRMGSHASNISRDSSAKSGKSKSYSTWDVSNTGTEFGGPDVPDPRLRAGSIVSGTDSLGASRGGTEDQQPKPYGLGKVTNAYKMKPKTKSDGLSMFKPAGIEKKAVLVTNEDDDDENNLGNTEQADLQLRGSPAGSATPISPLTPTAAASNPFIDYEGSIGGGAHHASVTGKLSSSSELGVPTGGGGGGLFGLFRSSGERKREREKEAAKKVKVAVGTQTARLEDVVNDGVSVEYQQMSKKDMCDVIDKLKVQLKGKQAKIKDMEEYIDSLLLRVLDRNPSILNMAAPSAGSTGGNSSNTRQNGVFAM